MININPFFAITIDESYKEIEPNSVSVTLQFGNQDVSNEANTSSTNKDVKFILVSVKKGEYEDLDEKIIIGNHYKIKFSEENNIHNIDCELTYRTIEKQKDTEFTVLRFVPLTGAIDEITLKNGGSGPTGDVDYPSQVKNKPQIDGVELVGNKTAEALGLTSLDTFTSETQTINNNLTSINNKVDGIITKKTNEIELKLTNDVKVSFENKTNNIDILGEGKTINYPQGIKVGGNEVATKNEIVGRYTNDFSTSITIGTDMAANELVITDNLPNINITNIGKSDIGINHLYVKNNDDTNKITISSGYGTLEIKELAITISQGNNSATLSFVDGQLAINGKKISTE